MSNKHTLLLFLQDIFMRNSKLRTGNGWGHKSKPQLQVGMDSPQCNLDKYPLQLAMLLDGKLPKRTGNNKQCNPDKHLLHLAMMLLDGRLPKCTGNRNNKQCNPDKHR